MAASRTETVPLVCLHKLGGWKAEWNALGRHWNAPRIALDLPGHGLAPQSTPPDVQPVEASAEEVVAALDAMNVDTFDLAGTSLGGAIAVRIASRWPSRVRHLTLIAVALTPASSVEDMRATDARSTKLYDQDDNPRPRGPEDMEALFGVRDVHVQADLEAARRAAGRWIRPSWRGVALADVAGWLPGIAAPTMLLYGDRGGYRQFEAIGRERIARCAVAVVPDSGSFPHQEQPAVTAALMRR